MVQGRLDGIKSIHCGLVVQAPISDRPISVPPVPTSERIRSTSVEGSTCDAATIPSLSMVGNCVSTRSVTRCTRFNARGPDEMATEKRNIAGPAADIEDAHTFCDPGSLQEATRDRIDQPGLSAEAAQFRLCMSQCVAGIAQLNVHVALLLIVMKIYAVKAYERDNNPTIQELNTPVIRSDHHFINPAHGALVLARQFMIGRIRQKPMWAFGSSPSQTAK